MKKVLLFVGIFALSFIIAIASVQKVYGVTITSRDITVELTISDAYYTDADDDTFADDVVANFELEIDSEKLTKLSLIFELTLPSGLEYSYSYYLKLAPDDYKGTMTFYNHATEAGWYLLTITCILLEHNALAYGSETLLFDPPTGGEPGDDPPTVSLLLT